MALSAKQHHAVQTQDCQRTRLLINAQLVEWQRRRQALQLVWQSCVRHLICSILQLSVLEVKCVTGHITKHWNSLRTPAVNVIFSGAAATADNEPQQELAR